MIGGVAGSGLAGYAADKTKGFAVHLGQKAANVAVDGANDIAHGAESGWSATSGARHAIADGASSAAHTVEHELDKINPF